MFSDFQKDQTSKDGRGRRTASLFIAGAAFLVLGGALAAALAIRHEIQRREAEVAVEFAAIDMPEEELPEPEPEPEPEPAPARRAPAAAVDGPPNEIPDARPEESDAELAEAEDEGPIDGTYDGVEGGEGSGIDVEPVAPPPPEPPPGPPRPPRRPPRQERVEVQAPSVISGCGAPERPDTLEGETAETIRIRVRVVVGVDGRVMRATVTEGHPLIPEETILTCVRSRIFEPATLEGTPVPYVMSYVFTFRPDIL